MIIEEEQISKIIKSIEDIFYNNNIISHLKRLIRENKDSICFINDNCLSAKKYDEEFEININNNYFSICSTSWGHTVKKKITFFKYDNNLILTFYNDEITDDGLIQQYYGYQFSNDKLKKATYIKKIKLDYLIKKERRIIDKEEVINIYPIDCNQALKSIKINEKETYYLTQIKEISPEEIDLFGFIFSRMDYPTDYNNYKRILTNR